MIKTVEAHKKIMKNFQDRNIGYSIPISYRVVIKGLHNSTPQENIKADLILLGHQVRNVTYITCKVTKLPAPMFFVEPHPNNKEIFNIKSINNTIVAVEAFCECTC